jgi:hypothetical protein
LPEQHVAILLTNAVASTFSVPDVRPAMLPVIVPVGGGSGGGNPLTDVSISGLGRLFAAASTFQTQLAAMQPGAATSGTGRNFGTDVASFAAQAQNFVDAFNQVRAAVADLPGVAQASRFAQSLDDMAMATFANGTSGVNTLAQIGIERVAPAVAGGNATLGIDMRSLQLAFQADPAAAFSLLTEAVESFGNLAAGVQTGRDTTNTSAILSQIIALQATLGLFNGATNSAPLGLAALLALEPTNPAANNLGQQIAALSQFALVSSLVS